jgi:hypothetical protein
MVQTDADRRATGAETRGALVGPGGVTSARAGEPSGFTPGDHDLGEPLTNLRDSHQVTTSGPE